MDGSPTLALEISLDRYLKVRQQSIALCEPLQTEDYVAQPVVDVSPPRWHLAHTTWFFEKFILCEHLDGYEIFNPDYHFLFNSYYIQAGERWQRANRGALTRPTVQEIMDYRKHVDHHMHLLFDRPLSDRLMYLLEVGLNHEQQHQELLLYDIKHILGINPLHPVYRTAGSSETQIATNTDWLRVSSGTYEIGYRGDGFHFDNEEGRHTVYLHDFEIADRLVTNGEYLEFMEAGGYTSGPLWLDEAWTWVQTEEVRAPMYWLKEGQRWMHYTLGGLQPINENEPLAHVSFYEADAFARWKGVRLPTEEEWEVACNLFWQDS